MGYVKISFGECGICGGKIHTWGVLWRKWIHIDERATRKPQHPDGWKRYDHKASR